MPGRFTFAAFLLLLLGRPLAACSVAAWDPNDLVANEPIYSANRQFCAVVRRYDGIADFTSERAGKVFGLDNPEPADADAISAPAPQSETVTAALYEMTPRGRRLVAEIPLDRATTDEVLVSDSGMALVAIRHLGGSGW